MRSVALAAFLLFVSGCASPSDPDASGDDDTRQTSPEPPVHLPGETILVDERAGMLVYRLSGEGVPFQVYTGDAPGYCVNVPDDTVSLEVVLRWDDPRPLMLEVQNSNERHTNYNDDVAQSLTVTSPSTIRIEDPTSGEWQIWSGPVFADAARAWEMDVTWTIGHAGATLAETEYHGNSICD